MKNEFTYEQIQNIICMLCSVDKSCIFGKKGQEKIIKAGIPCIQTDNDVNILDDDSEEVIATCKWLYSDNPSNDGYFETEELDFIVIDENYYNSLKK